MKTTALLTLTALLSFLLGGCNQETLPDRNSYILEVHLSGDYNDYLFLAGEEMDSVLVVDGVARFTGEMPVPEQVAVIPKGTSIAPARVYLENSHIKMYGHYILATDTRPQRIRVDSIVGSKMQDLLEDWQNDYQRLTADRENPESLNARMTRVIAEKIKLSDNLGGWILARSAERLSQEQLRSLYEQIDTTAIPGTELRMIQRALTRKSNIGKNVAWENYELIPSTSEKENILANTGGKRKLLHFWATWCGPCIQNFPALDSVVDQYQAQLQPLGLSIDFDSTRWHNYLIDEQRLDGEYLLPGAWEHPLAKDLEIDRIPYYILLDENDQMIRQGGLADVIAGLEE
ncbi:TlpA disulfide reductase family protein [Flavilitoribacter nigricans]|nr:TlpA disulfide reductase family protein [Flavilitoribacter nigricans]